MPTKPKTLAIVPKQVLRLACISVVPVLVACGDDDHDHPRDVALAIAGYGGAGGVIALAVGGYGGGTAGNIALGVGGFGGGGVGGAIALAVGGFGGGDEDAGTEDAGES